MVCAEFGTNEIFRAKGKYMFIRRLGQYERNLCANGHHCPQFLEMADGSIAVVGEDITDEAIPAMPPGPGVGPKERVIRVPRQVFIAARVDIPAAA
jgi:hypothetical protein